MQRKSCSVFLVSVFIISLMSPLSNASNSNREIDIEIHMEPNGISDDYTIEIPVGEIISDLELTISEQPHPENKVLTLSEKADWLAGSLIDGMDYNQTGLRVLPNSFEWDFEGSTQGWSFSGGGWAHGYDTTLGATAGVHTGNSALYTYTGNYPNYMGGPYWATSPVIDCTSCSGTWDFKYWKRLGVESRSYDRAYVSVKNTNNAWVNIYTNPYGTVNDGSFSQSTHDVSSYINGNPNFQVRFGLGSSDGSVTYTGWNVDDVTIEPRTNAGTGSANWTSMPFGPAALGQMNTDYGLMSIDAEIPSGGMILWSLIDATDGTEIPGFANMIDMSADLAAINVEEHPSLQLKILMTSTSESPIIHKIKIGGGIAESFNINDGGWTGYTSFSNSKLSGNGILYSPEWKSSTPFSQVNFDYSVTGSGTFETCFEKRSNCDSLNWSSVPQSGVYRLNEPSVYLNTRWNGSGSYSLDYFEADLLRQSSPENVRIDIGLDGINEWSLQKSYFGPWGIQNQIIDSGKSKEITVGNSPEEAFEFFYPYAENNFHSTGNMHFFVTPKSQSVNNLQLDFYFGSNLILTKSIPSLSFPELVEFSDIEMQSLFNDLKSTNPNSTLNGLEIHKITVKASSSESRDIIISGLTIPYSFTAEIEGESSKGIISAVNSQIGVLPESSGYTVVKIPIIMDKKGSITITESKFETTGSPNPISMEMMNEVETLVAGEDWYEFVSVFDLSEIGVTDAQTHFSNNAWSSIFTLSGNNLVRNMECSLTTMNCNVEQALILGDFNYSFDQSLVEFYHKVKISTIWPDEEGLIAYSAINMDEILSEPAQYRLGLGNDMGVEQDITVVDWGLSYGNGSRSSIVDPYIDPSSECTVEVELKFDNLTSYPISDNFNIVLLVDGIVTDSTRSLYNGVASLNFSPDPSLTKYDLAISVEGLYGQEVSWNVGKNATFRLDETSPIIVSSNIGKFDHKSTSEALELEFLISDRPVLPRHAFLHIQSTEGGHEIIELDKPSNLNGFQGIYSKIIDVSNFNEGDVLFGWLEIIDPAGHYLIDSGSPEDPLFILKFGNDGPPTILQQGLQWGQDDYWLHPSQVYTLEIPISDINGYGDIEYVDIDLGYSTGENLNLQWSALTGCESLIQTIEIIGCEILGNTSHFDPEFTLEIAFKIDWQFNPDSSLVRTVMVEVKDDAGQSFSRELARQWRYSSEMQVDLDSVMFVGNNSYIAPGNPAEIVADVIWTKGEQLVLESVEISAKYSDYSFFGVSNNGTSNVQITASNYSGIYPVTLDLVNLPIGAIDRTLNEKIATWVVVDGNQPLVSSIISPNPSEEVQERDWKDMQFEFLVKEPEGLDVDSLMLHWLIIPRGMNLPDFALLDGNASMEIIAGTGAGNAIPLAANVDIDSIIPEVSRQNSWDLWIWVTGQDLSGQTISESFNNRSTPLAKLELASRKSDLVLKPENIILSNNDPVVGNPVWINVTMENLGHVAGSTSLRIEVIEDGNQRRLLEILTFQIEGNSSESFEIKWLPEESGAAWVEITTPDGKFARTSPIQINDDSSEFVIEGLEGANSSMLTGFGIIIFGMLGLLGYLVISGRKSDEISYDESEFV